MKVYYSLENLPPITKPCALTIGNFDAVHAGHQHLISILKKNGYAVAVSFSNHPSEIFPDRPLVPLVCPAKQKLALLEKHGLDLVLCIPFTQEIANSSFEDFLRKIKQKINFAHLIIGKGAAFGKDQKGEESAVRLLAKELRFEAHYIAKVSVDGKPICTSRIREELSQKNFCNISKLLKRPYTLYLDFHYNPTSKTWETQESKLYLPPTGEYNVGVVAYGVSYLARLHINKEDCLLQMVIDDLKISQAGSLTFEVIFPTCNEHLHHS